MWKNRKRLAGNKSKLTAMLSMTLDYMVRALFPIILRTDG